MNGQDYASRAKRRGGADPELFLFGPDTKGDSPRRIRDRDTSIRRLNVGDGRTIEASSFEGLGIVLDSFTRSLDAEGWIVVVSDDQLETVRSSWSEGVERHVQTLVDTIGRIDPAFLDDTPIAVWLEGVHLTGGGEALLVPLKRSAHHPEIDVCLVFAGLDEGRRVDIEAACVEQWPAVAVYLTLWQTMCAARNRMAGLEGALDAVAIGIVMLAKDSRIVFANGAARDMIRRHDAVREHRGQLQAVHRDDATALAASIGHLLADQNVSDAESRGPLLRLRRQEGPAIVASLVHAHQRRDFGEEANVLLLLVDPSLDIRSLAEPVCRLFQLSRVETELACLLASGNTLIAAAEALHVKLDTARGYLKQIFTKTGSNRQVDLVRLIFSNIVRVT